MKPSTVGIRELAGWGFDESSRGHLDLASTEARSFLGHAHTALMQRPKFQDATAILHELTVAERSRYSHYLQREDIRAEYSGLRWTIAFVDLRRLIAFQRRILLTSVNQSAKTKLSGDWESLSRLAFEGVRTTTVHRCIQQSGADIESFEMRTWNPDLQLRFDAKAAQPMRLHGGSPFFEVAEYHGRWFLRDGYHRAFALLQAGIHTMPAIVVDARNMAEVGAVHPWFFDEATLFSEHPPMVTDFLDDRLVLRYERARMIKRITLRIEESLHPADEDDCAALHQDEETP